MHSASNAKGIKKKIECYQPIHLRVSLLAPMCLSRGECNEKRVPQVTGLNE